MIGCKYLQFILSPQLVYYRIAKYIFTYVPESPFNEKNCTHIHMFAIVIFSHHVIIIIISENGRSKLIKLMMNFNLVHLFLKQVYMKALKNYAFSLIILINVIYFIWHSCLVCNLMYEAKSI